jgi:hypothetical protein
MPATPLNAPARPMLTGLVPLILVMALLAVLSLAFAMNRPARHDPPAPDRPAFTRRISTLPAIIVTAPQAAAEPELYELATP